MKIANIVSHNKVNVSEHFNVVESMDKIIHGLPTLIIGFDYVNKHYPDFDIMERKLGDNLYWTVKRTEKRDKYEEDLSWFMNKVLKDLVADVNYVFVDPIQYHGKVIRKIIKKFYSIPNKITYQDGQMLYVYGEKIIFGIDLKLLKYIGLNPIKIKQKILAQSSVFLGDSDILIEYKNSVEELDDKVRYIPYLFSITNEQNDTSSLIHISRES
ncbi:MAG: hypothetical protein E6R13_09835 [Spirochaetes bacterium]|nr:MAG: hypothetical protein E6R13_09835 [Spirochaetota bacterium]